MIMGGCCRHLKAMAMHCFLSHNLFFALLHMTACMLYNTFKHAWCCFVYTDFGKNSNPFGKSLMTFLKHGLSMTHLCVANEVCPLWNVFTLSSRWQHSAHGLHHHDFLVADTIHINSIETGACWWLVCDDVSTDTFEQFISNFLGRNATMWTCKLKDHHLHTTLHKTFLRFHKVGKTSEMVSAEAKWIVHSLPLSLQAEQSFVFRTSVRPIYF